MNEVKLGLGNPPTRIYLTVGEADNCFWARNDGDKWCGVSERALWGRVSDIRLVPKEVRGKPGYKLDVTVEADHVYVIRSGSETTFARGLLLALNSLENLNEVLALCVEGGTNNDKVVFAKVYRTNGEAIKVQWDAKAKLLPVVQSLQGKLGVEVQTNVL